MPALVMTLTMAACGSGVDDSHSPRTAATPDAHAAPLATTPLTSDTPNGLSGTVVFQSDREGRSKLFAIDLSTLVVTRLTAGADHHDVDPAPSPDGRRLLFASTRFDTTTFDIALAAADGSGVRRLTTHRAFERYPSWAPDGQSAFLAGEQEGTQAVYRLALGSDEVTRVSPGPDRALHPAAAPDGRRLAYTLGTPDGLHVVVHDLTTGEIRRVDRGADGAAWPAWSPDGTRLAVTRLRPDGTHLEIVDLQGGAPRPIAIAGFAQLREPAWSPDGTFLVASASPQASEPADWDLVLIRLTPAVTAHPLTRGRGSDGRPAWTAR